jgi:putative transposase
MPRNARLMLAGLPVHVLQRGHNHSPCFFAPDDYRRYLDLLALFAPRFGCAVHAYCLMPNHVHLLLTPATTQSCAQLMKHLGQRYAQHINRTYARSGTLWEGRFRSCLVEAERYFLACQRYIELNPVRAGLVRQPAGYPWSSHLAHAGPTDGGEDVSEPHPTYLALGADEGACRATWRALCMLSPEPRVLDAIRQATNSGFVLGSTYFAADVATRLGRRVARGTPGRPTKAAALEVGGTPAP